MNVGMKGNDKGKLGESTLRKLLTKKVELYKRPLFLFIASNI